MEKYLRNLKLIYIFSIFSPIVFVIIFSIVLPKGTVMQNDNFDTIFKYLVPIFALVFISIGLIISKKKLHEIKLEENSESKLFKYRGISLMRMAFLEGIVLFSLIAYITTLNNLYIFYALIVMSLFIPIFPTLRRIVTELNIETTEFKTYNESKPSNFISKNSWIVIPVIIVMVFLNYNSIKELMQNKVVLPNVQIDSGVLNDTVYHNDFLGWTVYLPKGFNPIPFSTMEKYEKQGNTLFKNKGTKDNEEIGLLNVYSDYIYFTSSITFQALFPELKNEKDYAESIDRMMLNAKIDSVEITKTNESTLLIDSAEFRLSEYIMTGKANRGIISMYHFFDEYILILSFSYTSNEKAIEFLNRLKKSKFEKITN